MTLEDSHRRIDVAFPRSTFESMASGNTTATPVTPF